MKSPVASLRTPADVSASQTPTVYVPFEPGIGAEQSLATPAIIARRVDRVPDTQTVGTAAADAWFDRPALDNLIDLRDRQPASPKTRITVLRDERSLFVAFDCAEPEFEKIRRAVPADAPNGALKLFEQYMPRVVDHDDHVGVAIDSTHNHRNILWLKLNPNGAKRTTRVAPVMSWAAVPDNADDERDPETPVNWDGHVARTGSGWRAAFRVPLGDIHVDPMKQPTIGIHLSRARYGDCLRHFASSATLPRHNLTPPSMCDLYLNAGEVTVRSVNWQHREYGQNKLTIEMHGDTARSVNVSATVVHDSGATQTAETKSNLPAGQATKVPLTYLMPHNYESADLRLQVRDAASNEVLFAATYLLGNHANLNVNNNRPSPQASSNPKPTDPEFHRRKREYVLSNLPRFTRQTTAQGAPSDFTLQSVDGRIAFNLMEAGALRKIGRWIESLFDTAADRLIAAVLFGNEDWVTTHCAARVGMHSELTALSALRLGAGHCYSRAIATAGIMANIIDPRTGELFETYPTLVLGHVVVSVRWRDSWTLLDPSFGHFFYNADNTDLATDIELEQHPELIRRAGLSDRRRRNYTKRVAHVRLEQSVVVWPAGAPPE